MRRKSVFFVVVGIACLLGVTAGTADASEHPSSVIVFTVANIGPADCGLSFDMVSPAGALLGRPRSSSTSTGCRAASCSRSTEEPSPPGQVASQVRPARSSAPGTVQFTATAVITKITCVVHLD
jgi:hypothetical protein